MGSVSLYLWLIRVAASIGRISRWGYSFCAIGVPGGLAPMLDCGGCTIILGSISAPTRGLSVSGLGSLSIFGWRSIRGGTGPEKCHPGGSLLKSLAGGATMSGVCPGCQGLRETAQSIGRVPSFLRRTADRGSQIASHPPIQESTCG